MSNREECAAYFKADPAWNRYFVLIRKKWESYGRTVGSVTLKQVTENERRAVEKVLGKKMQGSNVHFTLKELEDALQKTRFAPIALKEVLDAYYGTEIETNQARRDSQREKKERFFARLMEYFDQKEGGYKYGVSWLSWVSGQKKYGYSVLMTEWKRSEMNAESLVRNVCEALRYLMDNEIGELPLAVLAAEVSGNPHYFDRGATAGVLFVNALCSILAYEYPQNAAEWREILFRSGILPDEISNTVTVYGLHLELEEGLHPAFEGFCRMREPGILMASTLKKAKRVFGEDQTVYVVENEMVFSFLTEHMKEKTAALICTSGQPRTAALKLIELLLESESKLESEFNSESKEKLQILYSGDIDPEGIRIADRLWQRFPDSIKIWRMGADDYEKSVSDEIISERRLVMLENVLCPELAETAQKVKLRKRAAYQENLIADLLEDIK